MNSNSLGAHMDVCMSSYYVCLELVAMAAVVCVYTYGMDVNLRFAFMHCMFSDYHNLDKPNEYEYERHVCLLSA